MDSFTPLPQEVFDQICVAIVANDLPSVRELALVSKRCLVTANRYGFHHVYFTIVSRKRLSTDIHLLNEILRSNSAFSSVRHLSVRGYMPPHEQDHGRMKPLGEDFYHEGITDEFTCLDYKYRTKRLVNSESET